DAGDGGTPARKAAGQRAGSGSQIHDALAGTSDLEAIQLGEELRRKALAVLRVVGRGLSEIERHDTGEFNPVDRCMPPSLRGRHDRTDAGAYRSDPRGGHPDLG